jgi:hypothetical protein
MWKSTSFSPTLFLFLLKLEGYLGNHITLALLLLSSRISLPFFPACWLFSLRKRAHPYFLSFWFHMAAHSSYLHVIPINKQRETHTQAKHFSPFLLFFLSSLLSRTPLPLSFSLFFFFLSSSLFSRTDQPFLFLSFPFSLLSLPVRYRSSSLWLIWWTLETRSPAMWSDFRRKSVGISGFRWLRIPDLCVRFPLLSCLWFHLYSPDFSINGMGPLLGWFRLKS